MMDVMRPELFCVGRRIYRRNPGRAAAAAPAPYREEEEADFGADADEPDADEAGPVAGLTRLPNGTWHLEMPLPAAVFPTLVGRHGETRRRVEVETRTTVRIPAQGKSGPVVVEGPRAGVLSARTRLELLTRTARQHLPFSHFLSLPVGGEAVQGVERFREAALDLCGGDRGVGHNLFQAPARLHLTLGVMTLLDDSEVRTAARLLEESADEVKQVVDSPLLVHCVGLDYMNDDPAEVDVLYMRVAPADGSDQLQRLADLLVDRFVAADLMPRQYDHVKLHVTLMNSRFREDPSAPGAARALRGARPGRGEQPRESFDASNLLRRLGDFDFARGVAIAEVHLSRRFSTGEDGYYTCDGRLRL